MSKDKQTNEAKPRPLTPKNEKETAERRWIQDALEDDEVNESLASLRAKTQKQRHAR
jgi:hypothetical protein